jgi:hypothetical protein
MIVSAAQLTGGWGTVRIARSLVCEGSVAPSDAILLENFDPSYLVFKRAGALRQARLASRVLVPILVEDDTFDPNALALRIAEMMADIAQIGTYEIVPIKQVEPISLNAAKDLHRYLEREHIASVIVVTSAFRSRRSALVYDATFGRAGIRVHCQPVEGPRGVNAYLRSWHGIQELVEQWLKLQYYRIYALPFSDSEHREDV